MFAQCCSAVPHICGTSMNSARLREVGIGVIGAALILYYVLCLTLLVNPFWKVRSTVTSQQKRRTWTWIGFTTATLTLSVVLLVVALVKKQVPFPGQCGDSLFHSTAAIFSHHILLMIFLDVIRLSSGSAEVRSMAV